MAASAREITDFRASDDSSQSSATPDVEGLAEKRRKLNDSSASAEDFLDMKPHTYYIQLLKGTPSTWNDKHATHVYKGFKVTKYIIENNFIFDPDLDQNYLHVKEILGRSDGAEWLTVKEKLEETLGLFFVPGVEKMANGLFDRDIFVKASALLQHQMDNGKYSEDAYIEKVQRHLREGLIEFMADVEAGYSSYQPEEQDKLKKGSGKKKQVARLNEKVFERYLQELFHVLEKISDNNPILRKSASGHMQFAISPLGTVSPEPDFIVKNCRNKMIAVVEVKPHHKQMFPLYRGHKMPGERKRDAAQGEVKETAQTSFPTRDEEEEDDMNDAFDEDDTYASFPGIRSEEEIKDQEMDDTFDENETLKESVKVEDLGQYIRRLEVKEKKQVRCFLPQLIAELMGSCSQETLASRKLFNTPTETKRLGIGVVGVKARFVTMVIQDKSWKSKYPGPSDIEKNKHVMTKVFMTQELNLFKKSHLMMVFELLFTMSKI